MLATLKAVFLELVAAFFPEHGTRNSQRGILREFPYKKLERSLSNEMSASRLPITS